MEETVTDIDQQVEQPPQKKLSVKEFAAKIKAKYPDYNSINDDELVKRIITKYPDYSEQVEVVQKKSPSESASATSGTTSSEPSKAKQEFQFNLPSARDVAMGQMARPDETVAKNVEQSLTATDTAMHGEERKQARLDLVEKKRKAAPTAVVNAARKSLKIKGLDPNNTALIEKEKAKFAKQLANGDADVAFDKDGNAGLLDNKGIFESFHDHMMNAINANKEAREFKDMTTQQRVEFANKKMQGTPSPYLGDKESNAASFTGLLGDVTPTLGLYGAGAAVGGVIEATGGTTAIPLRPVMTFAFNAGSGANASAMNNVLERYNLIRQNNPNISDELAMSQAEKGEDIDRLAGIAETALFSAVGGKANVGKTTTGKLLKGIAKSGIDLGAKTAGVEFGRSLAQGEGGQDAYDKAIKKFEENAPVGSLLHATAAVLTGAMKAPAIIKNSLKHDVATKIPQEEVQSLLQKNIEEGNITQEQADKVSGDINEFRTALSKVPDGLPEDAQASVAGLILKRDNIKKEAGLKDESSVDIYNQEIESINNQIKEIYRTGKPLEHEINEATGELYKQPTHDEPDLLNRAKEIANSDEVKGFSADILKEAANGNTEQFSQFLKEISEQANDPQSNSATIKTYGKELVDIAQKLNPVEEKQSSSKPVDVPLDKGKDWGKDNINEIPIYRGTTSREGFDTTTGFYTGNKNEAQNYSNGILHEKRFKPDAKVLIIAEGNNKRYKINAEAAAEFEKITGTPYDQVINDKKIGITGTLWGKSEQAEALIKAGYDGVVGHTIDGQAIVVLNSKAIEDFTPQSEKQIKQDVPLVDKEIENPKNENQTPPPIEPPKEEVRPTYIEQPPTSLSYSGTGKLETEFGINEREATKTKHDIETIKEADNLIEKGWKVNDAIDKIEKGEHTPSDAEYINMTRYAAELAQRLRDTDINSKEYDPLLRELGRVADASNSAGKEQGRALGIRGRFRTVQDGTYADFMLTERDVNNGAELTPNQKETAQTQFNKFEKASQDWSKSESELAAKESEINADRKIKKTNKPATKKTHEDYVKEREEIFTSIKDKLRKARGETNVIILPYAKELIAIAPDVLKLARNLVEDGVVKLSDVVKNIHGQLREDIPQLKEKDIHDIIAGEYAKPKSTKKEAAILMEDLRIEAQLINKYERLLNGTEPKTEKQKRQRNMEINELRTKIKNFRKEEVEANAFYGEDKNADAKALKSLKEKNQRETERIKDKIQKGDFAPDEKKVPLLENKELREKYPELYKDALRSKDELIKIKREIALRRLREMYENKTPEEKVIEVFSKTLNVPRTLMASFDLSAPLRQGVIATTAHPIMASQALRFMLQSAKSEKIYNRWLDDIHNSERWPVAEKTGLAITDPESLHVKQAEEAFQGAPYAEKIPLIGEGVKASERAYIGYLNHLRWNLFNMYAERFENAGKTYENNPKLYEGLSSFINSSTGRGNMKGLEGAAPVLNWFLFASKLIASRLNMLGVSDVPNLAVRGASQLIRGATFGKFNPKWGLDYGFYSKLPKELRLEAAKDMGKFLATGLSTLALVKFISNQSGGNITVEDDPRSTDFGKIRSGNTRWDIWGGFQPYARVLTQALSGQRKTTTTGAIQELNGEGFMGETRATPITSLLRGKLAPVPATAWNLIEGRDINGTKITPQGEALKLVSPLIIMDVIKAVQDQDVKALFTVGLPSAFGVGVQTFEPRSHSSSKTPTMPTPKQQKIPSLK